MKLRTLLLTLVIVGLMTPMAAFAERGSLSLGLVTFRIDDQVWPIYRYGSRLEVDLAKVPNMPGTGGPLAQKERSDLIPTVDLLVREAATAEAQVDAIEALLELGVSGIVLTPVSDVAALTPVLRKAQNQGVPIVFTHRPISGVGPMTAFVGVEPYALGKVWGEGAAGYGHTFAVISDSAVDPLQVNFAAGLQETAGEAWLGNHVVSAPGEAYDVAKQLIAENEDLGAIILGSLTCFEEVAQAIEEAIAENPDLVVRLGTWGMPSGVRWTERVTDAEGNQVTIPGNLQGAVTQDAYYVFLTALAALKGNLAFSMPLQDDYTVIKFTQSASLRQAYVIYPYTIPTRIVRFWR